MKAVARLFRSFSLRHVFRRKLRYLLAVLSIILAVALFVSMRVTEVSIVRSFERSLEALSGRADVVVTRGIGIEEGALAKIESVRGVRAAPIVQASTVASDLGRQVLVLGIDFARDARLRRYRLRQGIEADPAVLLLSPNAVVIARSFAERHGLRLRSPLVLDTRRGKRTFLVAGILEDEGPARALGGHIVAMHIRTAQRFFNRAGRYDRIEVALDGAGADEIRAALGPGAIVERVNKSSPVLEYLLVEQRLALSAVTVIAILIGVFIIYNSLSLSVVERVKEIGTLRALGARRREMVGTLLLEAGLIGAIASAAGAAVGILLSRLFIHQAAKQVNMLVYLVDIAEVSVPWDSIALAMGVGILTAIAGAFFPALSASRVSPMVAIRKATFGQSLSRGYRRTFVVGLISFLLSAVLSALPTTPFELMMLCIVMAFGGLALMIPQVILWVGSLLRVVARRVLRIEGYLAFDNLVKFPSRTALTVVAFAGSLSIIVVLWGVLVSFERAVDHWLRSILPFDLTLQLQDLSSGVYSPATFPGETLEEVRKDPRVLEAYGVRARFIPYGKETVMLIAFPPGTYHRLREARGIREYPGLVRWLTVSGPRGELGVSTNFANLHGIKEGDSVELLTAEGPRRFRVGEIWEDFSWPRGVVTLDLEAYRRFWKDEAVTYIDVAAKPGTDVERLRLDFARAFQGRFDVFIYDTKELRAHSMEIVRDWFRIADAQIFIALLIGAMGIVNTMLISLLTQSRQIGLLRAIGASMGQINVSLAVEAALIGLFAGLLGCALGIYVVKFPMSIMVMKESGYEIPFVFPVRGLTLALGGGIAIALLSSLIPLRFARKIDIIDSIGYE